MTDLVNLDAERAVVGAVLVRPEMVAELAELPLAEALDDRVCRTVYRAIRRLWDRQEPATLVTVPAEIMAMGGRDRQRWEDEVRALHQEADPFAAGYVRFDAEKLLELAARRAWAATGAALVKQAHDLAAALDVDAAAGELRQAVEAFRVPSSEAVTQAEQAAAVRDEALARWSGELVETVIPTGIRDLDRMLNGGIRPGEFFVLAGRPGMGKSAVALHLAKPRRALLVSLEMPWKMLQYRLIAAVAGVPYRVGVTAIGTVEERERWLEASEVVERLPITITDTIRTTAGIEAEAKRIGAEVVVIDHIGRLADPFKSSVSGYERMSTLSWRCKEMALRSNLALIGLSQLNREVEHRNGCLPFLSDLRESGRIEEDADHIGLLYSRMYYASRAMGGIERDDKLDYVTGTNWHRLTLNLAKNRNGSTGNVDLGWDAASMSLHDPEERFGRAA